MSSEIETNIVAVERIREYCKLNPEVRYTFYKSKQSSGVLLIKFILKAEWESKEGGVLPDNWPSKGAVDVSDLEVKYREDLKPALKDISCSLNPSEKVSLNY